MKLNQAREAEKEWLEICLRIQLFTMGIYIVIQSKRLCLMMICKLKPSRLEIWLMHGNILIAVLYYNAAVLWGCPSLHGSVSVLWMQEAPSLIHVISRQGQERPQSKTLQNCYLSVQIRGVKHKARGLDAAPRSNSSGPWDNLPYIEITKKRVGHSSSVICS